MELAGFQQPVKGQRSPLKILVLIQDQLEILDHLGGGGILGVAGHVDHPAVLQLCAEFQSGQHIVRQMIGLNGDALVVLLQISAGAAAGDTGFQLVDVVLKGIFQHTVERILADTHIHPHALPLLPQEGHQHLLLLVNGPLI